MARPRVYLAGPEVFLTRQNPVEVGRIKRGICEEYGLEGIFPLDNEMDIADKSKKDAGLAIARANIDMIRRSHGIIANLTPFRGPSADSGTISELAFAAGIGKALEAYSNTVSEYRERVKSDIYHVEDFGLFDNLMLPGFLEKDGAEIVTRSVNSGVDLYTDLTAFRICVSRMASRFFESQAAE